MFISSPFYVYITFLQVIFLQWVGFKFSSITKGHACYSQSLDAPINVKPLQGGRPGMGGVFDVTSLPVMGTFNHSLSSGARDFRL